MSKNKEGKYQPSLVYKSFIEAVAKVRQYGIEKYGKSEDWRTTPSIEHFDAMLRHIYAYMSGEAKDEASGLSHLYHAAANLMFEIERREGPFVRCVEHANVPVTCPRCKSSDEYPLYGTYLCTGGCGYFIEPMLKGL